jgi:NADPH-dependent ferric siderophore reductase
MMANEDGHGGSEMAEAVLDQLNGPYEDSLLLVARILGDRRAGTWARATHVDLAGVDVVLRDPEGEHPLRIDFAEPAADEAAIGLSAMALVAVARERSGEEGQTSAERMMAQMGAIRTFLTEVVEVEDVHPALRRITFAGGDLDSFAPLGPDTFVYLLLPPPGRPDLAPDASFSWEAVGRMAEDERPVGAYYTVRSWRSERAELDVLFVLHDDHPAASGGAVGGGHASRWAAAASPGDRVALWGPRTAYAPPADTDAYLLVADETGLPAVAAIVESLSESVPVRIFAEVGSEGERQALPVRDGVEVTWLHRDGAEPGTTTLLLDAVLAAAPPGPTTYVWGGAESRAMTAVRRHVRRVVGLPRERVSLTGYWRHRDTPYEPDEE